MSARVPGLAKEMVTRLRSIEPAIADSFFPPASEADIRRLERTTKQVVPDDLRTFWKTYDGQDLRSFGVFDGDFLFLPVEAAVDDWLRKKEVYETDTEWMQFEASTQVRAEVWNRGWIPFAWARTGDTLCVDLSPTEAGDVGQVIITRVATDYYGLLSRSFADWLEELVCDLRVGRFTSDPKRKGKVLHDKRWA